MKILLLGVYAGSLLPLLFYCVMYLKKSEVQDSDGNSNQSKNDRHNYAGLRPLERLLANIAFSFGEISLIWFIAFMLL